MALTITHTFVSGFADDPAQAAKGEVLPSHWNASHSISGSATLTPAGSNLTFHVDTAGSDSNDGSSAHPFATIAHAVLIASGFDYQAQFFPTIDVNAGTYTISLTILLPELINISPVAGVRGKIVGGGYATTIINAQSLNTPAIRASGSFANWDISEITVDCDSCCFESINGSTISLSNNIGLNDSSGLGDVTFFQTGGGGFMASAGGTFNVLTAAFFAIVENTSLLTSGIRGFLSFLSCTVSLQANSVGNWIFSKQGDFDGTFKFRVMTYVNAGSFTGAQAIVAGTGGFIYIITDNALLSDLPGQSTTNAVDNSVYITNSNSTKSGWFMARHAGPPTTSQIAQDCWGVYKDTTPGGVVIACNDGGTLKSVALTT